MVLPFQFNLNLSECIIAQTLFSFVAAFESFSDHVRFNPGLDQICKAFANHSSLVELITMRSQ